MKYQTGRHIQVDGTDSLYLQSTVNPFDGADSWRVILHYTPLDNGLTHPLASNNSQKFKIGGYLAGSDGVVFYNTTYNFTRYNNEAGNKYVVIYDFDKNRTGSEFRLDIYDGAENLLSSELYDFGGSVPANFAPSGISKLFYVIGTVNPNQASLLQIERNGSLVHSWDASASDPAGTELVDTVAGNNASFTTQATWVTIADPCVITDLPTAIEAGSTVAFNYSGDDPTGITIDGVAVAFNASGGSGSLTMPPLESGTTHPRFGSQALVTTVDDSETNNRSHAVNVVLSGYTEVDLTLITNNTNSLTYSWPAEPKVGDQHLYNEAFFKCDENNKLILNREEEPGQPAIAEPPWSVTACSVLSNVLQVYKVETS